MPLIKNDLFSDAFFLSSVQSGQIHFISQQTEDCNIESTVQRSEAQGLVIWSGADMASHHPRRISQTCPCLHFAPLPGIRIRIDANQAWSPKQAVKLLNQMQDKGLDIEFVEQPVKAHDFEGLQYVTQRSYVPVLADESVFSPEDALKIMQMGAADMVNIKLMKCGGLYNALKITSTAEVYGVECMIGCMLEAKISVNAAVHLACAKQIITKIDLDGPVLCSEDPILGGAVFNEREITVSNDPGLGIHGIQGIRYLVD